MTEHTPGPWTITTAGRDGLGYGVHSNHLPVVKFRGLARPMSREGQANARLIAAAPDLLEAAKAGYIALMHANEPDDLDRKAMEMLGDAIRKAQAENSDG